MQLQSQATGDNTLNQISQSLRKTNIKKFNKFEIEGENDDLLTHISAACGLLFTLYLVSSEKEDGKNQLAYSSNNANKLIFLNIGNSNPTSLFCGYLNAAAINTDGSVIFIPQIVGKSQKLDSSRLPDDDRAISVACCNEFILVAGSSGRVFESKIPKTGNKLDFNLVESIDGEKIIEVSGTHEHCFCVTEDGKVFARGSNAYGQLGIGEEIENAKDFQLISELKKHKINHCAAGWTHSLFQTSEGKIFACGKNNYGQLLTDEPSRKLVYLPIDTQIKGKAKFCIAGTGTSLIFINHDPIKSPNHHVEQAKIKENEATKQKLDNKSAPIDETSDDTKKIRKKIVLQQLLYFSNILNIIYLKF